MSTVITSPKLKSITDDVLSALKQVSEKHRVVFSHQKGKYSNNSTGSITLDIAAISDDGVVMSRERRDYLDYGRMYDLRANWLDQTFVHNHVPYTIVGLNTNRRKFPVVCREQGSNKQMLFTVALVISKMNTMVSA